MDFEKQRQLEQLVLSSPGVALKRAAVVFRCPARGCLLGAGFQVGGRLWAVRKTVLHVDPWGTDAQRGPEGLPPEVSAGEIGALLDTPRLSYDVGRAGRLAGADYQVGAHCSRVLGDYDAPGNDTRVSCKHLEGHLTDADFLLGVQRVRAGSPEKKTIMFNPVTVALSDLVEDTEYLAHKWD